MEPQGVHHVSINVRDSATSVRFYTEVLGLSVRNDRPDFPFGGAWLDVGSQQLHLIEAPVPEDHGQHFAIGVDDLDAVVHELRASGVEVPDPKPVGTGRQTFVHDPDGNTVELHQPAAVAG
jgi:catechol 2,3-dioxygenase-like lactoylglutathione lyase family enzyme